MERLGTSQRGMHFPFTCRNVADDMSSKIGLRNENGSFGGVVNHSTLRGENQDAGAKLQ